MTNKPEDTHEKDIDHATGVETTGHEWDGIKELNNPMPRWWLYLWYFCIAIGVGYWVFMPSWPGLTDYVHGIRNYSDRVEVAKDLAEMRADRDAVGSRLLNAQSLSDIENDPELLQFAMAAGKSAFGDNCATCHGTGAQGFSGYPNLNDDVWLWGGSLDDIRFTITHGIRGSSDETRLSQMPSYGTQNLLSAVQISDLTDYVWAISGHEDANAEAVARAAPTYKAQCVACHGLDGTGIRALGAPNLTDSEWLYGGSRQQIRKQIFDGRNGVMPAWQERLDTTTIASLAVYVHTLGGGEAAVSADSE